MSAVLVPPELAVLAEEQCSVVTREQLRSAGIGIDSVRTQTRACRWQEVGPLVIVLHNGPLTKCQQMWVAVLSAPGSVAVAGRHAARLHGLKGWAGSEPEIVIPRGDRLPLLPFRVVVHESRRFKKTDVAPGKSPHRTAVERSVIDAAAWSSSARTACGLLCAAVQQGLTTADRLTKALRGAGRVRHCAVMRVVLLDIAGGAQALSEVDFGRFLALNGLPAPRRQAIRLDGSGKRRYLDVELEGPDGQILHIEIDGALHLLVSNYWNDMDRGNELVLTGSRLLRFPSISWRLEPDKVADQIRRGLQLPRAQEAA